MTKTKKDKQPTWTRLTLDTLIACDDFMSVRQIQITLRAKTSNAITAALFHLACRKAVDSVLGGDGKLWWFATPETDDRLRVVDQRSPEPEGNRCRGPKKLKT